MNATAWHSTLQPHRFSVEARVESFENAAGVSVYQLIVTKLSNREKLVVEGPRAELDELFRLYTMHRR